MKIKITEWQQLFQNCVSNPPLPISLPTIAIANPPYCKINLTSNSELARFEMAFEEGVRSQNPGVRINWMGIQTPTNCGHRTDVLGFKPVYSSATLTEFILNSGS